MGFNLGSGLDFLLGEDSAKPFTQPLLTPEGKKLEKGLFESIKSDLFPENRSIVNSKTPGKG